MTKRLFTLFLNGKYDSDIEKIGLEMKNKGYDISFSPTSGCTALWIDDYEITGYNFVKEKLEDYLQRKK